MVGHERLRIAILNQAVKDYKTAQLDDDVGMQITLERWFLSDWAQYLSGGMGEIIISKLKKGSGTDG